MPEQSCNPTLEIPAGHRLCKGPCARMLRLEIEFFPRNRDNRPPLDWMCHDCWEAKKKAEENRKRDEALAKVHENGLRMLERGALVNNVPHSAHLVEALYDAFGGVQGYAKELYVQYESCDQGSYGRTRVLELIARLTVENTKAGGAKKPIDLWTEEELNEELSARMDSAVIKLLEDSRRDTA